MKYFNRFILLVLFILVSLASMHNTVDLHIAFVCFVTTHLALMHSFFLKNHVLQQWQSFFLQLFKYCNVLV